MEVNGYKIEPRANLSGADLHGTNLRGADLYQAALSRANLRGAHLNEANLQEAYLNGADLRGADLCGTRLSGADLGRACLGCADLTWAHLNEANLQEADLSGADLTGANLRGANLRRVRLDEATRMPHGERWETYLGAVVPALLTAGGKSLPDVLATGCWECHDWTNCPMKAAFGIGRGADGPPLLIPRIKEFVQLFDAGLIPRPQV